jgi:serine/threonine protein kinase
VYIFLAISVKLSFFLLFFPHLYVPCFITAPAQIDERSAMHVFIQLALALEYLHNKSIVHRDIKAGNVFLSDGMIKLGDMGIAKGMYQRSHGLFFLHTACH